MNNSGFVAGVFVGGVLISAAWATALNGVNAKKDFLEKTLLELHCGDEVKRAKRERKVVCDIPSKKRIKVIFQDGKVIWKY